MLNKQHANIISKIFSEGEGVMYHVMDMLVPVAIFLGGIIVSWSAGGFGAQRIIEAQKNAGDLGRTMTYESPLRSEHDSIHSSSN